jgi:hypothetical protein
MAVAQCTAEADESQHIAHDIQAAAHIGFANAEFIQSAEGGQAFAIMDQDIDRGLALAKAISPIPP